MIVACRSFPIGHAKDVSFASREEISLNIFVLILLLVSCVHWKYMANLGMQKDSFQRLLRRGDHLDLIEILGPNLRRSRRDHNVTQGCQAWLRCQLKPMKTHPFQVDVYKTVTSAHDPSALCPWCVMVDEAI